MFVTESKPDVCPNCGFSPVSNCIYGLIGEPYVSEYLKKDEYMLMGCIVTEFDPSWICKQCETMFFDSHEKLIQYKRFYQSRMTSKDIAPLDNDWIILNDEGLESVPRRKGVYIFRNQQGSFGRLKGESDILYIGSTTNTLRQRMYQYLHPGPTQKTNIRINHMLSKYNVEVNWILNDTPRILESQLLQSYFSQHDELPPFNCQSASVPVKTPKSTKSSMKSMDNTEKVKAYLKEYDQPL